MSKHLAPPTVSEILNLEATLDAIRCGYEIEAPRRTARVRVERMGGLSGGYARGWITRRGDVGAWYPTWADAMKAATTATTWGPHRRGGALMIVYGSQLIDDSDVLGVVLLRDNPDGIMCDLVSMQIDKLTAAALFIQLGRRLRAQHDTEAKA